MSCVRLEELDLVTLGIHVDVSKLLDAYYILLWCEIGSYMFSSTDLLLTFLVIVAIVLHFPIYFTI